jgi:hypothetical protein
MHVVEIVKMDDEELYIPDDVLEEASELANVAKKIKVRLSERKGKIYG